MSSRLPTMSSLTTSVSPVLLDCTLRDGGYYTDWEFPLDIVNNYLNAISSAHVNIVELGYYFLTNEKYCGPFGYCNQNLLDKLLIPDNLQLSLMLNSKEIVSIDDISFLNSVFTSRSFPKNIEYIRIASRSSDIPKLKPVIDLLQSLGYLTVVNLMNISDVSDDSLRSICKIVSTYNLECFYIADSTGSVKPAMVPNILNILKTFSFKNIGAHFHDNQGCALANSICAFEHGAAWIDSSLTGMGRGPGNTRTEEVILELRGDSMDLNQLIPLYSLINKYFTPLQKEKGWGPNIYYYLSGRYSIHPSYITHMLSDPSFDACDILQVLSSLNSSNLSQYNNTVINDIRYPAFASSVGSWNASESIHTEKALLLGPGTRLKKYTPEISSIASRSDITTFAFNLSALELDPYIDFRIACNPLKIISNLDDYPLSAPPIILPMTILDNLECYLPKDQIRDYGIQIKPDLLKASTTYCIIPEPMVFLYSLVMLASTNVRVVYLAGLDGYALSDARYSHMKDMLSMVKESFPEMQLISLTPTSHDVKVISIYGFGD